MTKREVAAMVGTVRWWGVAKTVATITVGYLLLAGFDFTTPAKRFARQDGRIERLEGAIDSIGRGQRTSTYIACELFARQFPGVPKPEGCPR